MADTWGGEEAENQAFEAGGGYVEEEQQQHDGDMMGGGEEEEEDDVLDMGDDVEGPADDALLMRFCPHDSSILYPQEDKVNKQLRYACRRCRYSEESAHHSLIYRNVLKKEVGNVLTTVPGSISDDPTLARSQNANCQNCGHHEAVFFQSDTSDARNDTLALIFVCCNCDYKWVG
mmetsp:Transcript_17853/g.26436  ORF Transcript_17853/g.26436 Transcript_17853/m.26436 type:complete len:175 (-) Transcript_17853:2202-2726(-)